MHGPLLINILTKDSALLWLNQTHIIEGHTMFKDAIILRNPTAIKFTSMSYSRFTDLRNLCLG